MYAFAQINVKIDDIITDGCDVCACVCVVCVCVYQDSAGTSGNVLWCRLIQVATQTILLRISIYSVNHLIPQCTISSCHMTRTVILTYLMLSINRLET